MEKFKGTKGEWKSDSKLYHQPISNDHKIDVQTNGYVVELIFECIISEAEARANAKLIAAAPELLEAVQEMRLYFLANNHSGTSNKFLKMSEKALNKALGNENK